MKQFYWLLLAVVLPGCTQDSRSIAKVQRDSLPAIAHVLSAHTPTWMNLPGVEGTGQTTKDGKPAILIFVDTLTTNLRTQIPDTVEGYPVVIRQSGKIQTLPAK